jgi:thioredoxin 1
MKFSEITSPDKLKRAITKEYCLICCGTSWSIPCRKQYSILKRLAGEHSRWDCIAILDIERCPDAVTLWTIQSIPTTIVFSNGSEVGRLVGLKSYLKLHAALNRIFPPGFAGQFSGPAETMQCGQSKV